MPESRISPDKDGGQDEAMDEWGQRFFDAMAEYDSILREIRADLFEAVDAGDAMLTRRLRGALRFLTVELRKRSHKSYGEEPQMLRLRLRGR